MALRVCSKTIHCFGRTNIQPALFIAKFKSNLYAWMHLVVSQRRSEFTTPTCYLKTPVHWWSVANLPRPPAALMYAIAPGNELSPLDHGRPSLSEVVAIPLLLANML